jgi:hypothetical protein
MHAFISVSQWQGLKDSGSILAAYLEKISHLENPDPCDVTGHTSPIETNELHPAYKKLRKD